MKAATGQSPSPGKQKAVALAQLTRAPISSPKKKVATSVLQEPQKPLALQVVEPPPLGVSQAEPAPVVVAPPSVAEQQPGPAFPHTPLSRPFQTFQEVDPGLAKKQEGWQADKREEAARRRTKREKNEEFLIAAEEGAFRTDEGRAGLHKCYQILQKRHQRREQHRRDVVLGIEKEDEQMESKHFTTWVASIRESCKDDPSGMFELFCGRVPG